jgi:hypothetical protein
LPWWSIALLALAATMWLSPLGVVVALIMGGIIVTEYPGAATVIAIWLALIIVTRSVSNGVRDAVRLR